METFGLLTINNGFGGGWWCVCFGVCFAQQNRNQRRCELVGEPLEDKIGSSESGVGGLLGGSWGGHGAAFPTKSSIKPNCHPCTPARTTLASQDSLKEMIATHNIVSRSGGVGHIFPLNAHL